MSKRTTRAKWLKAGPTAAQRKRVPLGSHAAGHNVELKIVRDIQEGDRAVRLAFPGLLHPSLAAAGLLPDPPADQLASWLPPAADPDPEPDPVGFILREELPDGEATPRSGSLETLPAALGVADGATGPGGVSELRPRPDAG